MHGTADNVSDRDREEGDRSEEDTLNRSKDRTCSCNVQKVD